MNYQFSFKFLSHLHTLYAAVLNKIGRLKYASGDYDSARRMFEQAGNLGLASGFYNLSSLEMQTGRMDEGVKSYRRAFAIDPDYERLLTLHITPGYLQIETVRTCNAACVMCPLETSKMPRIAMSDEVFSRLIEQIGFLTPIPPVALHGLNEPLMDKKLIPRIKQLKAAGVSTVSVVSNGSLMTKEKAAELIESGINDISFSIESVDALTFEGIRIGLKLEDVLRGILDFIAVRNEVSKFLPVRLLFTYSERNRQQYEQFRAYWLPILSPEKGDTISALPIHSFGKFYMYNNDNTKACYQLFTDMHIRADGTVSLSRCAVSTWIRNIRWAIFPRTISSRFIIPIRSGSIATGT
jgi:tetratricopeptide (TPR) repeat protein